MKVTLFIDVLSHWCLAAWPAFEEAGAQCDTQLRIAPLNDGKPTGYSPASERWFYKRGSLAYGMELRADWYESERTTTLYANAAALAASHLGADLPRAANAAMRAAMHDGVMLGRRDVAIATIASLLSIDRDVLARAMESSEVRRDLRAGNDELRALGCSERPAWLITNANGDRVTMQGVWQKEAVLAVIAALGADETAYARAGTPPE